MIWIVLGIMFLLWIFYKIERIKTRGEEESKTTLSHVDTCVCCGAYIPEGRMVCERCEKNIMEDE